MLLAYTFGQGLATAALVTFIFVWFLVAMRIIRRDDIGVLGMNSARTCSHGVSE